MTKKAKIDIEEFKRYYIEEGHTLSECGRYFSCSSSSLLRIIRKYGWYKKHRTAKMRSNCGKGRRICSWKNHLTTEELYQYWVLENHSLEECSEHFGCSIGVIHRVRREGKLRKTKVQVLSKTQATNLQRYGNVCSLRGEEVREKTKQTLQLRFGVSNVAQSPAVKKKIVATNLARYGCKNPMQNEAIKARFREGLPVGKTWTGQESLPDWVINVLHDADSFRAFVDSQENKTIISLAKKLGVNKDTLTYRIHQMGMDDVVVWLYRKSHYEEEIRVWLKDEGYEFVSSRKVLYPDYELDLYNEAYRVAIEFNGDYWHAKKPKGYHYKKSLACEKKGIRLIHIYEYEWNNPRQREIYKNIILSALKSPKLIPVFARKCSIEVRPSKEMRQFFEENNIQGFRGGKFAICLMYEGEIIMSYMMGRSHFAKGKYDWEVIRGATKLGYYVIGGASKLWKYFLRTYNPKNCVYYVDFNQFNGQSVERLGFTFLRTKLSFKNYWVREKVVKNRDPSHHKEIKALMDEGLVLPLWNAGVKTYVWGEPNF